MTNSLSGEPAPLRSSRTSLQYTGAFIDIAARWKEKGDARVERAREVDGGERGSLRLLLLHFHLVTASRFGTLYKLSNVKLFASSSHTSRVYTHLSDPLCEPPCGLSHAHPIGLVTSSMNYRGVKRKNSDNLLVTSRDSVGCWRNCYYCLTMTTIRSGRLIESYRKTQS